ncbi:MAG: ATP-NAD kinase family protein [Spongiibacteraceae bacterium]|jgi:predicted polyphosphate/ATP-dependent NAD kinase
MFKLGLVVNPLAGIGGPLALKGSDDIVAAAAIAAKDLRSSLRATAALAGIATPDKVQIYCFAGAMGESAAAAAGFSPIIIGEALQQHSNAEDTVLAAMALRDSGVDLILFAGGDGTARDVFRGVGSQFPVLGVPAGVKMHSGVYAVSPQAAGDLLNRLIDGLLVHVGLAEVRDIDEQAFRQGRVTSKFYGELLVPTEGHFLQQTKNSGREVEVLVIQDIAADIVESMDDDTLYIIGPGTTTRAIMEQLGLDNTLLGVDVIQSGQLIGNDLNEQQLLACITEHSGPVKIIITAIGGQGHILGRGNQQLSPSVIRAAGLESIVVVATKTKITELEGRPLLVDSNDPQLDQQLSGYRQVITGYHDAIIYPVGLNANGDAKTF